MRLLRPSGGPAIVGTAALAGLLLTLQGQVATAFRAPPCRLFCSWGSQAGTARAGLSHVGNTQWPLPTDLPASLTAMGQGMGSGSLMAMAAVRSSAAPVGGGSHAGNRLRLEDITIEEADIKDSRRLVEFVLECDGEAFTAGRDKRDRLDARLRYHMSSGVQIYMARESRTTGVRGRLMGIYACTVIDYLPIPRLPVADEGGPFPSTCNQAARRFISDVKVANEFKRRGVGTCMLQHFEKQTIGGESVVACLFVTKDNAAGMGLYEKLGYVRVAADFTRKRFRPLLHAGAIDVEDLDSVWFYAKYIQGQPSVAEEAEGSMLQYAM